MAALRSPELQSFLASAEDAIHRRSGSDDRVQLAAQRIFTSLTTASTCAGQQKAARLPVCDHLPRAMEEARAVGSVADAFAGIEPQLTWKRRDGAERQGEAFLNGHANATIVGPEGIEIRRDVWIGVSLMAPQTRYPDHHHPPEEFYLVLSRGQWRQASNPWHEPGIGGLVYNPPDIVHAMRSMDEPLLALWFLWTGQQNG